MPETQGLNPRERAEGAASLCSAAGAKELQLWCARSTERGMLPAEAGTAFLSPRGWSEAGTGSYHGQGHDSHQVLLADEDLGQGDVGGAAAGVLHLPGDGLRPRQAAEAGDLKAQLHDLVEQAGAPGESKTGKGRAITFSEEGKRRASVTGKCSCLYAGITL